MSNTLPGNGTIIAATQAQWTATTIPVLKTTLAYESDTRQFKFGDGVSLYSELPYVTLGATYNGETFTSVNAGPEITLSVTDGVLTIGQSASGGYPYDIGMSFAIGTYLSAQELCRYEFVRPVVFAINFGTSVSSLGIATTAETAFGIYQNGNLVGLVTFGAGDSIGVVTTVDEAPVNFTTGDILTVVSPATPDTTAATLSLTMTGTR